MLIEEDEHIFCRSGILCPGAEAGDQDHDGKADEPKRNQIYGGGTTNL